MNPWPASTAPARCKKIRYYHNDLNGLPEQLTEADGHNVWQATYRVWGNTLEEVREPYYIEEQNLRFQGQYLDRETGLHFNTFRFYDPDVGRFTTPDPIGLAGGLNFFYQYGPNPSSWIDPAGLSTCSSGKGYKFSFGSLRHILRRHSPHVGPPKQLPYSAMKPSRQKGSLFPAGWSNRDIAKATKEVANNPSNQVISNREGFSGKSI